MICKFIKENEMHEKYLLNKLTELEKSEYLTHLDSCDSCRIRMESEKKLIAGIRQFSKNEFKSEISRQVDSIKLNEPKVSWDMVLKVAAIFFFLVVTPGLVYYYQYIEPSQISDTINPDKTVNPIINTEKSPSESTKISKISEQQLNQKKEKILLGKSLEYEGTKASGGSALPQKMEQYNTSNKDKINLDEIIDDSNISNSQKRETKNKFSRSTGVLNGLTTSETKDIKIDNPDPTNSREEQAKPNNFSKPINVISSSINSKKSYPEYNRKIKAAAPSSLKNTESIQISDKESNEIKRLVAKTLSYMIGDQSIVINLIKDSIYSETHSEKILPDSFRVIVKAKKADVLTTDWFVNQNFIDIEPDSIFIKLSDQDRMIVNIKNKITYEINMHSDSTKAKRKY